MKNNDNMTCFKNIYYKYVVKYPVLFFTFMIVGIFTFLYFSFNTEVTLIETFEGNYADDRLIINEVVDYPINKAYAYQNRSDKVIEYEITDVEIIDECYTVLYFCSTDVNTSLEGTIKIDVEKQKIKIINMLWGMQKRYVEDQ